MTRMPSYCNKYDILKLPSFKDHAIDSLPVVDEENDTKKLWEGVTKSTLLDYIIVQARNMKYKEEVWRWKKKSLYIVFQFFGRT